MLLLPVAACNSEETISVELINQANILMNLCTDARVYILSYDAPRSVDITRYYKSSIPNTMCQVPT